MQFIRFADLAPSRVSSRASASSSAPISTCRRTTPAASPTTRASAPRCRPSALALDKGAAVMVTSHLGRPTEGEFKPRIRWRRSRARLSELLGRRCRWCRTGSTASTSRPARWCCWKTAAEQGREEGQRRAGEEDGALCDVFVMDAFGTAHRAQASTHGIAQVRAQSPAPARC